MYKENKKKGKMKNRQSQMNKPTATENDDTNQREATKKCKALLHINPTEYFTQPSSTTVQGALITKDMTGSSLI